LKNNIAIIFIIIIKETQNTKMSTVIISKKGFTVHKPKVTFGQNTVHEVERIDPEIEYCDKCDRILEPSPECDRLKICPTCRCP